MDLFRVNHTWIRSTFSKYSREMKGLDWGAMFDEFGENTYDTAALEKQIHDFMEDDEIMKKSGIYRNVLSGELRDLSVIDMFQSRFPSSSLGRSPMFLA